MEQTFDEWFGIFTSEVRKAGYNGPIDKESFLDEYQAEVAPEDAAKTFADEMLE